MIKKFLLLLPILALSLVLINTTFAHAQLILVNVQVKIVKPERENNRLQVRVHEKGNKDVQYVDIDKNTRFSINNKPISFDQAWRLFKRDQIIRVKGGYSMNLHVKAKSIYM